MFCYQCEQTAKGEGCTKIGVCGKPHDVASLQDLLVYALQGLSLYAAVQAPLTGSKKPVRFLPPSADRKLSAFCSRKEYGSQDPRSRRGLSWDRGFWRIT